MSKTLTLPNTDFVGDTTEIQRYRPGTLSADDATQTSFRANLFSAIPRKHNRRKPVSRGTYESSRLCRVYELNMRDSFIRNIPRAGVIFYTFINDELYLCFGRDKLSGELTDFGGRKHTNENPIHCAIREGNEESRYAFSKISAHQVQYFSCLYSSNMLIIFIPVASPNEIDIRLITSNNFNERKFLNYYQKNDRRYNEISEIVWLNESQISDIFSNRPTLSMFAKVRRFIYSCNQLSQNIHTMKRVLKGVISAVSEQYSTQDLQKLYKEDIDHTCEPKINGTTINEAVAATERVVQTVHLTC